jgi:hypothetical protein
MISEGTAYADRQIDDACECNKIGTLAVVVWRRG